jgi:hypothetical protein
MDIISGSMCPVAGMYADHQVIEDQTFPCSASHGWFTTSTGSNGQDRPGDQTTGLLREAETTSNHLVT